MLHAAPLPDDARDSREKRKCEKRKLHRDSTTCLTHRQPLRTARLEQPATARA